MAVKSKAVNGHVGTNPSYIRNSRSLFMRRYIQQHIRPVSTRDVGYVGIRRQRVHNRLARLDLAQCNKALSGALQRLGNRLRRLRLSFSTNDGGLAFLFGLGAGSERIRKIEHQRTFSTMNLARSASCCAICLASTAWVNS